MTLYEELLDLAYELGVEVVEMRFDSPRIKGLYCDGVIAINSELETSGEKACVLAEELGHHCTSSGDIIDQSDVMSRRQERRARVYGSRLITIKDRLAEAVQAGCSNLYEVSEYLQLPEWYLCDVCS